MFKMKGVIPPMITPFDEKGAVDRDALKELVLFLRDHVDGLFIAGSYGSGVMLTLEEREQLARDTIKYAGSKIPTIVHVGTADSLSAQRLAQSAAACGAAAVSAVGPYYFKHGDEEVIAYYSALVEAAGDVPVYVYNNPKFQGYPMSLGLIGRLKSCGVSGIKDATFDIMEHANYMRLYKDDKFDVALGTEAMWLSACALGCEAFIPGIGNAFPEICQKLYLEGMKGEYEKCRDTQFVVNEMRDIMYLAHSTQLAIYAMLEIRGIIKAYPRAPFISASEQEKAAIKARLEQLGMLR